MMGKKLAPVVVLVTLLTMLGPLTGFALGLGPITMRSALNQPLLAEIDVHSLQPGDLDKLAIRLAARDDFKRVNVERSAFLTRIKFAISFRDDGSTYVKLTTSRPVTEPYLDFLIEARWPRGRALKEYTVLVDPPVLTAETPAPVQQATIAPVFAPKAAPKPQSRRLVRKARPAPVSKPETGSRRFNQPKTDLTTPVFKPRGRPVAANVAPATIPAPQPSRSSDSGSLNYGVVKRNDTLSEIAQAMRTESEEAASVSLQQLMLALLRSNPKAFIRGNVNQLKAGFKLRIDDPSILQELSRSEAVAEVRNQTIAWRNRKAGRLLRQVESSEEVATADRDTGIGSAATTDKIVEADNEAQLKLVAPGKEGQGTGSGKESGEVAKLNSELLLATESLDTNRRETGELKTRLSDLEEQLSSMQRLIMLKDEEMLALQNRLKDGKDAPVVKTVKKEDRSAAPKRSRTGRDDEGFLSDTLLMGAVALLIIGVIGWLVIRRRKMQSGFEESILNVGMADQVGAATFSGTASQPHSQSGVVSDFAMSDMGGIQSDSAEVDPISEADVYLAYGRHQQAEDIIQQALGTTPDRLDLHVKLLEVYHAAHNRPAFEDHAQQFHAKIAGDESNTHWARVAALGAEIAPDHALFGGSVAGIATDNSPADVGGVTAEEEDLLDFDFDTAGSMDSTDFGADDALDLDVSGLDFDLEDDELNSETLANIDNVDSDNSIEFDMGTTNITPPPAASVEQGSELDLSLDSGEMSLDALQLTEENAELDQLAEIAISGNSPELTLDMESNEQASDSGDGGFDFDFDVLDTDSVDVADDGIGDSAAESNVIAFDGESMGDDLDDDIFSEADEVGTKLDLAKAYVDMGDSDGARSILDEVMEEGDDDQKYQAEQLLQQMG